MRHITEGTFGNFSSFKVEHMENGGHKVYLNGMEIPYVRHLTFELGIDCIATATVEFDISSVECNYILGEGDPT